MKQHKFKTKNNLCGAIIKKRSGKDEQGQEKCYENHFGYTVGGAFIERCTDASFCGNGTAVS